MKEKIDAYFLRNALPIDEETRVSLRLVSRQNGENERSGEERPAGDTPGKALLKIFQAPPFGLLREEHCETAPRESMKANRDEKDRAWEKRFLLAPEWVSLAPENVLALREPVLRTPIESSFLLVKSVCASGNVGIVREAESANSPKGVKMKYQPYNL
ncbi:MAG: hypothetical protein IPL87_02285 [Candidatus Moraniibacteriota bacterium]|nr:MAG: hypothetical protein IPL87_02285 [Candidatus Moranbacteria bacterium]